MTRFILGLASAGFVGYCPLASGTAGTVVGVLLFLLYSPFPPLIYLLTTVALFVLAWWVSERAEILLSQKDSPKIVIDEVVGYLISMTFLPPTLTAITAAFLFFRLFDIIKPPPARAIHRQMGGGLAVVLDDAVAGIYTNILIELAVLWRPEIIFMLDRFLLRTG